MPVVCTIYSSVRVHVFITRLQQIAGTTCQWRDWQHHDPAWRQGEPSWLLFLSDITDFLDARGMTSDNYGKYMETRCLWHTPCIPLVCLCSYCITLGGFNTELCSIQYSSFMVSYAAGNWETDIENCIPYNWEQQPAHLWSINGIRLW